MNKKQRVLTALDGGQVDRIPVCFWHHFGQIGPERTVREHVRFYEESGVDLLKMMCDEFFVYPLSDTSVDTLAKLHPLGRTHPYVRGQVERAAQVYEALHGEAVVLYNAFSPYATLKHTLGDAESMALLREHESVALHVLDVIAEDTCAMVEGVLRESGALGMMLPLQGAEEGRFTASEYQRLIAPTEKRVIDCAHTFSHMNLLHMCGWDGVPNHLEWWTGYPGRMVNWAVYNEGVSLSQARTLFPGRVLMGGFDNRTCGVLYTGTEEMIKAETRRLRAEAGEQAVMLGADCSLPSDIDRRHIRWVIEALEEER